MDRKNEQSLWGVILWLLRDSSYLQIDIKITWNLKVVESEVLYLCGRGPIFSS